MKNNKLTNFILMSILAIGILVVLFLAFYLYNDTFTFYLKENTIEIKEGEYYIIEIIPKKQGYLYYKNYTFESKDETIATVDEFGNVTPIGEGTTEIIIKSKKGFHTKKINIIVSKQENLKINKAWFSSETYALKKGNTLNLKIITEPNNIKLNNTKWSSSNTNIATVDSNGKVEALSTGEVVITATLDNNIQATCKIIIQEQEIESTSITLNKQNISLYQGNSETLTATILPENSTNKNITWTSSNNNIVSVLDGVITAKNIGTATITATLSNGLKTTCIVTVQKKNIKPTSIALNKKNIILYPKDTDIITAEILPKTSSNQTVIWTSDNENVATVENGKITAKGIGTATITAKIANTNIATTINVEVVEKIIPVTGVTLNKTSGVVYTNSSNKIVNLTATVYPTNANNKKISWKSSNTNIATVENGKITAKTPGTATITVTTEDGEFTASYKLTVKKKAIVVITASQGVRMNKWFESYISKNKNYYSKSDNTLKYIYLSGSGFDFQYGDGLTQAINYINEQFSSYKKYVDLNVYFTLTGNSVKLFTCDEIQTTDEYINIAKKYNESIQKIKNLGYPSVQGHVISHSPLNTKHPLAKQNKIVYSHYEEACKSGYRSAWKYYLSNNRAKTIINSNEYPNIKFVDNWSNFLIIKDEANRKFTWLQTFTTPDDDPLHWDEPTTILYMQLAFDSANM